MKRYTVSQARERLADVLDAAESGERVVIERRGVRFALQADPPGLAEPKRAPRSLIESVDDAVATGTWTWAWRARGLTFSKRRQRS